MRILRLTLALITISAAVAPGLGQAKPKGGAKGGAAGRKGESVWGGPRPGAGDDRKCQSNSSARLGEGGEGCARGAQEQIWAGLRSGDSEDGLLSFAARTRALAAKRTWDRYIKLGEFWRTR